MTPAADPPVDAEAAISRRTALGTLLGAVLALPVSAAGGADGRVVDASALGVVADGVTDDAPALARAVGALADGAVLVLPPGTIALGSPGWPGIAVRGLSNIRIQGQGSTLKWLFPPRQAAGPFGPAGLLLQSCRGATVAALRLDGNRIDCIGLALENCVACLVFDVEAYAHGGAKPSGLGQLVSCKGRGNTWLACTARNSTRGSQYRGFYLGNANSGWGETDLRIQECAAIENDATGFAIGATRLICMGSVADGNLGSGFISGSAPGSGSYDHLFQANHSRRNSFHGWQTDVYGPDVERIVLTGNNLSDNAYCGVLCHRGIQVTISSNLMSGNGAPTGSGAVEISHSESVIVSGNQIRGDEAHGICISVGLFKNRIKGLLIATNGCAGSTSNTVWLEARDDECALEDIVFTGNVVRGGSHGILVGTSSPRGRLDGLVVSNNLVDGAQVANYRFADATPGQTRQLRLSGNAGGNAEFGRHVLPVHDSGNCWNSAIGHGRGPPREGDWQTGAIVYNDAPAQGGPVGWVCTAGGAPGIWHGFGLVGGQGDGQT